MYLNPLLNFHHLKLRGCQNPPIWCLAVVGCIPQVGHGGRGDNLNPNLNDNYAIRGVEFRVEEVDGGAAEQVWRA